MLPVKTWEICSLMLLGAAVGCLTTVLAAKALENRASPVILQGIRADNRAEVLTICYWKDGRPIASVSGITQAVGLLAGSADSITIKPEHHE